MGKNDAQRTKGNTKAASSARSAKVLGENTGFVGFGTTAEAGFVPLLQPDDGVPPDFRLAMRKMNKKDVTTKLKALQEFLDLSISASEQDMLAVLAFWPSVYSKLASDTDRRVREQAHIALEAVVKIVGKNLAPHLKSMAGVWYIGQSDSHIPAAEAATAAWTAAFPPHKLAGAVEFCQAEILNLIIENLVNATPQTLSDPKTTPPEEMEAKYTRTVSMSLISYANLLEAIEKTDPEKHKPLLDSQKFWKLAKHKAGNIRKSFFVAVTQLCIKMPEEIQLRGAQVVPAVLCNLQDNESGDAVWTCTLQLLSILPTAWTLTSPHKAVFPAVWKLLGAGGAGYARRVYPYLMPFISRIPVSVMEDPEKFTTRWFTTMLEGLDAVKKKKNSSESEIIVQSFLECMFYFLNLKELDSQIKTKLVRDYLVPGVRENPSCPGMYSTLSDYLLYWDKISGSNSETDQLNLLFWAELKYESSKPENQSIDFLVCLGKAMEKKEKGESKGEKRIVKPVGEFIKILESRWTSEVENLSTPEKAETSLDILYKILSNFGQYEEIFGHGMEEKNMVDFYHSKIIPLLSNLNLEESLAKFTWTLANRLSEVEALNVLDMFVKKTRPHLISQLVDEAKRSRSTLFSSWLCSVSVQEMVVEVANNLIHHLVEGHTQDNENWNTIKSILDSGVPTPEQTQQKLFSTFLDGLNSIRNKENRPSSARVVEFICDLLGLLTISHQDVVAESSGTELIKLIFSMHSSGFGEGTRRKLEHCWISAVQNQPKLANALSLKISEQLVKPICMDELDRLKSKASSLARVVSKKNIELLVENLEIMIPDADWNLAEQAWYRTVFDQKQFKDSISEKFGYSLIQQAEIEPINLILPNRTLIFLSVLSQGLGIDLSSVIEPATVLDEERFNLPDSFLKNDKLMNRLCEAPFVVVYMQNLVRDKNCSADITNLESELNLAATSLFSKLSKVNLERIEQTVFSRCDEEYWGLALQWILGLTYKYSEWDIRLSRFTGLDGTDIESNYNTLVSLMELTSQYNIGSGTISSSLSLAVGKLASLEGLITEESTQILWFVTQCLNLARTGLRLHISGVSEFSGEIQAVLEMVVNWKTETEDQLLYNTDLSEYSWSEINKVCTVCNLLHLVVSKYPDLIQPQVWDLITCSLVSWVGTLQESKDSLTSRAGSMMFSVSCSRLAASVAALLGPKGHHPSLSLPRPCSVQVPLDKLREEWDEFFSQGIFMILVPLYIQVCAGKEHLYSCNLLSTALGQALVHAPLPLVLQCELPPLYLVQDVDAPSLPDNITFIFNHFGPLLLSNCRSSQVTAAHILAAVTQEIPKNVDVSGDSEENEVPLRLVEALQQGELLLSTLLVEFSISDPVGEIPTGTIAFSQTFGYLLAWRVILRLLEKSSDEVRPRYSQYLESRGHISHLLSNIFKLLPRGAGQLELVFAAPLLEVGADTCSTELQQLAASCWTQVCGHLPASARQWWSKLDRESQGTVERITCSYVTPALWTQEVNIISAAEKCENLTLKVRDSVREVVATYSIDEGSMELVVALPSNYPLGGLNVDSGKRVGVESGQWRKWMLQLTTFLIHQNGSIHEGLNLWKKNVDKRFEGVEECYICFYILHGSNHQLPKLGCRTCKKKFHSACLYKWFSTSNNSSCPLCRNLF